jgi:hypothetical protein
MANKQSNPLDERRSPVDSRPATLGVGALLVVIGVLFLMQNFDLFGDLENLIWLVLFGGSGLAFLYVFATNQQRWWAVIPGFVLLSLGVLVGFGDRLGPWGGALFLGSIGLAFGVIYFVHRDFWWAVIPAGVLVTLAAVAAMGDNLPGAATAGIFFLGLSATFALVYLLPVAEGRQRWAAIPALVLGVIGLLSALSLSGLINYIWAAGLIVGGVYLLRRTKPLER